MTGQSEFDRALSGRRVKQESERKKEKENMLASQNNKESFKFVFARQKSTRILKRGRNREKHEKNIKVEKLKV